MEQASHLIEKERRVIILRHGERVDMAFGKSWTENCFNESQSYIRTDLNMPENLPSRPIEEWKEDSPLTTLGSFQAELLGSSLKSHGVKFSKVFVSPAYRSIKTASSVLSGMGMDNKLALNIEYGLYEWLGFCKFSGHRIPQWLSEEKLGEIFDIDKSYKPVFDRKFLERNFEESVEEFYHRNSNTVRELLKRSEGDILIVAHGANLDTCTRQLTGKLPRTRNDFLTFVRKVPFLGSSAMQQKGENFYLIDPPCLTLTHTSCAKFDWKILNDD
jgi:ubiquitin-associated and SH3 domain-containing protein